MPFISLQLFDLMLIENKTRKESGKLPSKGEIFLCYHEPFASSMFILPCQEGISHQAYVCHVTTYSPSITQTLDLSKIPLQN